MGAVKGRDPDPYRGKSGIRVCFSPLIRRIPDPPLRPSKILRISISFVVNPKILETFPKWCRISHLYIVREGTHTSCTHTPGGYPPPPSPLPARLSLRPTPRPPPAPGRGGGPGAPPGFSIDVFRAKNAPRVPPRAHTRAPPPAGAGDACDS